MDKEEIYRNQLEQFHYCDVGILSMCWNSFRRDTFMKFVQYDRYHSINDNVVPWFNRDQIGEIGLEVVLTRRIQVAVSGCFYFGIEDS